MNTEKSPAPNQKSTIKRYLPHFVIAAILINTGAISFLVDLINILATSLTTALRLRMTWGVLPLDITTGRIYGNIALIVVFLFVALRAYKGESNARN